MKILVIMENAWNDTNSVGNTYSNFFRKFDDSEFACIFFRQESPANSICKKYFRVTETQIIKNYFKPENIGESFDIDDIKTQNNRTFLKSSEKKLIYFIHKFNLKSVYSISARVWESDKWLNKNLYNFVKSFDPDIAVTFVKSVPQYAKTVRFLKENFDLPLFSWIADDEYSLLLKNKKYKEIDNLKYIISHSQAVAGCSKEVCEYYKGIFNCDAFPLYKGCEFLYPVENHVNSPLKIVYAGNLLYGRLEVIKAFAFVLDNMPCDVPKAFFSIYSNTAISNKDTEFFNELKYSEFKGMASYDEILKELHSSDIVLHVESFDKNEILKVKYSFSTKIIDYLQSSSVIFAIGPEGQSSVEYIKKIPGTCVVNDLDLLERETMSLLKDRSNFYNREKEIREFAEKYHNINDNSRNLKQLFQNITEEKH